MSDWERLAAGTEPTDMEVIAMRGLRVSLREIAEPIGPLHGWWDTIFDIEAILKGRKPMLDQAVSVYIDDANRLLNKHYKWTDKMEKVTSHIGGTTIPVKFEDLEERVIKWATDRGIVDNGHVHSQMLKCMEELGELAGAVARGKNIDDHLGDTLVTLILVAKMRGTNCTRGLAIAYDEIKDRKGFLTADGIFVKEGDDHGHE